MHVKDVMAIADRADPAAGTVRLAFLGRGVVHRPWTLSASAGGVEPAFVERLDPGALDDVRAFGPDVVVVFDPAGLPAGEIGALDALTLAWLTDPLPLAAGNADPWLAAERYRDAAAGGGLDAELGFDPAEYDRVLVSDPLAARLRPELGVWRSPPLPVDDAYFADPGRLPRRPRPLFLGPSTPHREELLVFAKHAYDLVHYAFGLDPDRLAAALADASVGVVLGTGPAHGFSPTAALHLAAGHLLVAEPLAPTRGLEPGLDHLVVRAPHELMRVLDQLAARPNAWEQVRLRGRFRAEGFRASRAWPRLLADLAADLRAFGARAPLA